MSQDDSAPEYIEEDIRPVPVVIVKSDEGPGEINRLRLNNYPIPSDLSTFQIAAHNATRQTMEVRYDKAGTGLVWLTANRVATAAQTAQCFKLNPGESLIFAGTHSLWAFGTAATVTDSISVREEFGDA